MHISNGSIGKCPFCLHLRKMCLGWNETDFNFEVERWTRTAVLARDQVPGSAGLSCSSPRPMRAGLTRDRARSPRFP